MGDTTYFDEELCRLRSLWIAAVRSREPAQIRATSQAYFERARKLQKASH